jgi:hypothetical protein
MSRAPQTADHPKSSANRQRRSILCLEGIFHYAPREYFRRSLRGRGRKTCPAINFAWASSHCAALHRAWPACCASRAAPGLGKWRCGLGSRNSSVNANPGVLDNDRRESAIGTKRTFLSHRSMSAFGGVEVSNASDLPTSSCDLVNLPLLRRT